MTERLCRKAVASRKPVFTLNNPGTAHLVELGAVAVPADDPASLVAEGDAIKDWLCGDSVPRTNK